MNKKKAYYNSETGDVEQETRVPQTDVEPLYVPGVTSQFMRTYIPAIDPSEADEWITMSRLRQLTCAFPPFGAKGDPLQKVIDELDRQGYHLRDTGCGTMAICVIYRDGDRIVPTADCDDGEQID